MEVTLTYHGSGAAFDGQTADGTTLTLDGSPDLGGLGLGARPMEMVLFGLAGCAAMDVLHIIRKGRRELTGAVIRAVGVRADSVPAVFESVHLEFELSGEEITEAVARRAVELSLERYCSVAQMLSPHVQITADISLIAD